MQDDNYNSSEVVSHECKREKRLELGMTMKEVADKVGVSEATISRWESGEIENMRRGAISSLAKALHISPNEIMGWESPSASDELPTVSPTGKKVDARTRRQLEKVLEDDDLTYNGVVLNAEDKEKVRKALELAFWDIKEMNKRKK